MISKMEMKIVITILGFVGTFLMATAMFLDIQQGAGLFYVSLLIGALLTVAAIVMAVKLFEQG